jgi:hypothetical protein
LRRLVSHNEISLLHKGAADDVRAALGSSFEREVWDTSVIEVDEILIRIA